MLRGTVAILSVTEFGVGVRDEVVVTGVRVGGMTFPGDGDGVRAVSLGATADAVVICSDLERILEKIIIPATAAHMTTNKITRFRDIPV